MVFGPCVGDAPGVCFLASPTWLGRFLLEGPLVPSGVLEGSKGTLGASLTPRVLKPYQDFVDLRGMKVLCTIFSKFRRSKEKTT